MTFSSTIKSYLLRIALLAAGCVFSFAAWSGDNDAAAQASSADHPLHTGVCLPAEEKVLPADYFYCLGAASYSHQNYVDAQRFFTEAASWASKPAQYVLGVMALTGDHQPRDIPKALGWMSLASERRNSPYATDYASLNKAASSEQKQAARKLLEQMRGTYADTVAATRAEARYRQGMADMTRVSRMGGNTCVGGVDPSRAGVGDENSDAVQTQFCPPSEQVAHDYDVAAVNVFDGWNGHVTVGPDQNVGKKTN